MAKYRKKPVVIEAMCWLGYVEEDDPHLDELGTWVESVGGDPDDFEPCNDGRLLIDTLEGKMTALPGDWIIQGVKGEFYSCKPDIFKATYEPVE